MKNKTKTKSSKQKASPEVACSVHANAPHLWAECFDNACNKNSPVVKGNKSNTWKKPKVDSHHATETKEINNDANAGSFEENEEILNDDNSTASSLDKVINDMIHNTHDINMDFANYVL